MGKASGRRKKSSQNSAANPIPQQRDPSPPPASSNSTANGTSSDLDPSLFLKRALELKEEGNRMFQSKDYAAALASYDRAIRLLPRAHPERAVFHSNRAACLMQMRPVDHQAVAAECSLALQAQPNFPRALLRRARALDALRRYDLALKDVHALLAVDPTNRDAIDLARKLGESSATAATQQQPQHQQPSPAALGASAVRGAPIAGLGPCLPARPVPSVAASSAIPLLQFLIQSGPPRFQEKAEFLLQCLPGTLTITIKRGNNLRQSVGNPSAYCKITLGSTPPRQTKVVSTGPTPEWDEAFAWAFDSPPKGQKLHISCKNKSKIGKSSFGKVTIQFDRVVMLGSVSGEYALQPDSKSGPSRNLEIEFQWSDK